MSFVLLAWGTIVVYDCFCFHIGSAWRHRQTFSRDDFSKTLRELKLTPSAVSSPISMLRVALLSISPVNYFS